jgi:hypothetical protein
MSRKVIFTSAGESWLKSPQKTLIKEAACKIPTARILGFTGIISSQAMRNTPIYSVYSDE